MYEAFFGLTRPPFRATPTLEGYFPGEQYEQCLHTLGRVIQRGEGPAAIIASPGLGKSMLGLRLADDFRDSHSVVLLSSSQLCTRRALLQCLLFELDMPFRGLTEGELRLSLIDRLQGNNQTGGEDQGLLLIVDEAHTLPLKLLEELRMMTNLVVSGRARIALVLLGSLRLEEHLGNPQLESLNQRIAARVYLHPLSGSETQRYIAHKIELAGARWESVIAAGAITTLYRATDGIPRLIDQTLDHALLLAAQASQRPVTAEMIERAWSDLQQLPIAWQSEVTSAASTEGIEFGPLDDGAGEDEFSELPQASADESWPAETQPNRLHAATPQRPQVEPSLFPWMGDELVEQAERQLERELGAVLDDNRSRAVEQPLPNALREIVDPFGSDFDEEFVLDGSQQRWVVEGDSSPILEAELIGSLDEKLRSEGFLADADRIATALPTQPPFSGESSFPASTCKSAGGWPGDDRDLLVIEEEVVDPMPIESDSELPVDFAEEANQAYLQLFSRLRQ
jgi:type II secretory pathway predicted ATPase ExeA